MNDDFYMISKHSLELSSRKFYIAMIIKLIKTYEDQMLTYMSYIPKACTISF